MGLRHSREVDALIEDLLDKEEIGDQKALLARLAEHDVHIAQPTLSRRLDRMGIRKIHGRYRKVSLEERNAAFPPFRVQTCPPNLLLVRTDAGFAQALALRIDRLAIEGLLGTVAGDDTILIAVDVGVADLAECSARLRRELESPANSPRKTVSG
jgi:transcriptional regulator of arginine metabolism